LFPYLTPTLKFGKKFELLQNIVSFYLHQIIQSSNILYPLLPHNGAIKPLPPTRNKSILHLYPKELSKSSLDQNLEIKELEKVLPNRSLLILIGDFLDPIDLKSLAKRHEIYLVLIRDYFEEHPKILGEREFIDLQSHKTAQFFFGKKELEQWKQGYLESEQRLKKHLNSLHIKYEKVISKPHDLI